MKETNGQDNFLDLVPVRNCKWETTEDGRTCFVVPRFRNRLLKWIASKHGKSEFVRVYLDDKGAAVWHLIDGTKSIEAIGKQLERENDETEERMFDRLSDYLSILARNKFIELKKNE
jgi:ribosomal protein L14E/L6E/L27E